METTTNHIADVGEMVKKENEDMNNNFTKADLKDGMIVAYRNREIRTILKRKLYGQEMGDKYIYCGGLESYNDDLTALSREGELDIMKVSYMGEVLWKRKELYTLGEIYQMVEEEKITKMQRLECKELFDKTALVMEVWCVINRKAPTYKDNFKYATERMWEIVE